MASRPSAQADYARRTARAQAAGYSSLAAQRTAQAHARGFTSRAAETQAAKQPTVAEVIQNFRDQGFKISDRAANQMSRRLIRQSYKKLNEKKNADRATIMTKAHEGADDGWYYH